MIQTMLVIFFFLLKRFYIMTSNQLQRISNVQTSPIYSHFAESVTGATSIRAYGQQDRFTDQSDSLLDKMQMSKYPTIVANRYVHHLSISYYKYYKYKQELPILIEFNYQKFHGVVSVTPPPDLMKKSTVISPFFSQKMTVAVLVVSGMK